uniref:Uncharacterized protein n=1 Tax=Romanomermis culicivorax TaxID=13658 RepID=A0A915KDI3_ROMCU
MGKMSESCRLPEIFSNQIRLENLRKDRHMADDSRDISMHNMFVFYENGGQQLNETIRINAKCEIGILTLLHQLLRQEEPWQCLAYGKLIIRLFSESPPTA